MSNSPETSLPERALAILKQKGNPFRQQFARNSDDATCSLYHVDDLFAGERQILSGLIETYRGHADRPTTVFTLLGPRGAGKTHLLHWLKHGPGPAPRLFVTPGTFRVDIAGAESSFLEYLLYQLINVLLAGDKQRGLRPLVYVGEQLTRAIIIEAFGGRSAREKLALFPATRLRRLAWKMGMGTGRRLNAVNELLNELRTSSEPCATLVARSNIHTGHLTYAALDHVDANESRDLHGELRRHIISGFVRATLADDETELADFLTDGFADLPHNLPPTRGQLTLSLLQALSEVIVGAGIPIVVAFDQLEELLYGQTDDDIRRSSDAFFGGIVQILSQVPGLCVLLFVEEGLWNRIVPPLAPHILDRIHEPIHVPNHGTLRQVRLSSPTAEQLAAVVACRVRRTLAGDVPVEKLPAGFPFGLAYLEDVSRRESVLRLMLQTCCNRLDELCDQARQVPSEGRSNKAAGPRPQVDIIPIRPHDPSSTDLIERWHQEVRSAERKLKPVGSLSGATAELQGGLARWLQVCKALGVEQGDWHVDSIQESISVGDHPTYGTLTVVEWRDASGASFHVGIGLWLGRGVGKPRDLETKLQVFGDPNVSIDHLILLRPADDVRLSGKSLEAWNTAITAQRSVRLEAVDLEIFAKLHAFPSWMQQVHESFAAADVPDEIYRFLAQQTEPIMGKLGLPESLQAAPSAEPVEYRKAG